VVFANLVKIAIYLCCGIEYNLWEVIKRNDKECLFYENFSPAAG
jgi:hypothetical protein